MTKAETTSTRAGAFTVSGSGTAATAAAERAAAACGGWRPARRTHDADRGKAPYHVAGLTLGTVRLDALRVLRDRNADLEPFTAVFADIVVTWHDRFLPYSTRQKPGPRCSPGYHESNIAYRRFTIIEIGIKVKIRNRQAAVSRWTIAPGGAPLKA
jgi:hypothetical protein